jgi:hypothetical protein
MNISRANRNELDSMVVNIELTLGSIIQGVALYFLTDNTRAILSAERMTAWPYTVVGLLLIFLFWSRSLIHTLTLIRWPLEFIHNFFYIACTLVEALAFNHLTDPPLWFALNTVFAALVWMLFIYDLRMIRTRGRETAGPAGERLYLIVEKDQRRNIFIIVPSILLFNLVCFWAIEHWPQFFLQHHGHLILVAIQGLVLVVYLIYVIRTFFVLTPLILGTREEWLRVTAEH